MTEETQEQNQINWSIHDTHPNMVSTMRDALAQVVDPEIGLNIIQLGLVRDIKFEEEILKIRMILTTPFCPYAPAMIEMTRQKAQESVNRPVTVEMGTEVWDFSMMEDPGALDWGMYA